MGRAIAIALSKQANFEVSVSNPHLAKINPLKKYKIAVSTQNSTVAEQSDVLILAVKPNLIESVLNEIKPALEPQKIVVSVAAGILISQMSKWSGHKKIVRTMPNTPVQVGMGFTAWYSKNLSKQEKLLVKQILSSTGEEMELDKEAAMDDIGTLSGCGPAYVFYFLEAMENAAIKFGFSKKESKQICLQTFAGAIQLAKNSNENFAQLRENVTSKGGVTHAAITHMENNGVKKIFQEAILKAKKRTLELRKV